MSAPDLLLPAATATGTPEGFQPKRLRTQTLATRRGVVPRDPIDAGREPWRGDLTAFAEKTIGGRAGELPIRDHTFPCAAGPNDGQRPRIVQDMNSDATADRPNPTWR